MSYEGNEITNCVEFIKGRWSISFLLGLLFTLTRIAKRFKSHASGKLIQIYVERAWALCDRLPMHTLKSLQFIVVTLISFSLLIFSKTNSTSPFSHIKLKAPPRGTTFALTMSCLMRSKWALVPLITVFSDYLICCYFSFAVAVLQSEPLKLNHLYLWSFLASMRTLALWTWPCFIASPASWTKN